jgi:hypothetical protein
MGRKISRSSTSKKNGRTVKSFTNLHVLVQCPYPVTGFMKNWLKDKPNTPASNPKIKTTERIWPIFHSGEVLGCRFTQSRGFSRLLQPD